MSPNPRESSGLRVAALRYGGAVLAVALALAARWGLDPISKTRQPFATFYLAAMLAALLGGLGPGLLATLLGALSAWYVFIEPRYQLWRDDAVSLIGLALFLVNMTALSLLAEARARARARELEHRERLLAEMTERQRVESELRVRDVRTRAFIDNSPAIHIIKDESFRYTYGNAAWASQFNRPPDELMGLDDFALFPEESARVFRESDRSVIDQGRSVEVLEQAGAKHWMSLKFPLDHDGRRYVGGIVLDVTERMEALEAIKRVEGRFRALADSMPQIVWTAMPDGTVDYFNKRWYDFTGLTEAESCTVEGWLSIFHPEDRRRTLEVWAASVGSGQPYEIEYRFKDRHRGGYRWHLGRALPARDDSGAIVHWYGSCTDIDDRKRAEQAAEAANQAKDRFLAVLSHELRTPLTPILLAVSALDGAPEVEDSLRPLLEMIRRNVELEARLIDDLLDVTRIIQGKMTYHPAPADAHALIRHAMEICRGDVEAAGCAVTLGLDAAEPRVMADPARLQQVFWNLIKNAVKFSDRGGSLAIRTRNGAGAGADGRGRLVVEFEDRGIGIAPEFLPRVFDPFEQGEPAFRTRKYGGLGLGLAISRSVVEAHGGTLSARSEGVGRGATFVMELDSLAAAEDAGGPPSPPCDAPARAGENLHILLVEDDLSTRQVLIRVLKRLGHRVTAADSVSAAVEAAEGQEGRVQMILSDIGLPDGSGLDVVRLLQPRLAVPAIALTGFGTEDDVRKGREAGFAAHLTKPIQADLLDATIRRVAASVA